MNRRLFLSALTGLAASAVMDPERLLWAPGKKRIFVPPAKWKCFLPEWAELPTVYLNGLMLWHGDWQQNGACIQLVEQPQSGDIVTVDFWKPRTNNAIGQYRSVRFCA